MWKIIGLLLLLVFCVEGAIQNERYNRPFPHLFNQTGTRVEKFSIKQRLINNPMADTSVKFLEFMNGCLVSGQLMGAKDGETNSVLHMFIHMARYLCDTYLNARWLCRFLFVLMLVIPYITGLYDEDQITKELVSRAAYYIIHVGNLLFRIATAMGISSWLVMILRQPSPCASFVQGTITYGIPSSNDPIELSFRDPYYTVEQEQPFNFPAHNIIVGVIFGMYLLERYNILFGLFYIFLIPVMSILAGYASIGQVLLALLLGLLFSLWGRVTPLVLRPIDAAFNLLPGPIALFLPKLFQKYQQTPWVFMQFYFESILYQIFVVVAFVTYFTFPFLKIILKKNLYRLRALDIQFLPFKMVPDLAVKDGENDGYRFMEDIHNSDERAVLRESNDDSIMSSLYNKRWLWIGITFVFLILFTLINILTYWWDDIVFPYFKWK